ncbi:centrosomal protein of 97 kDa isoform X2 [Hyperolius riggenbachi]|uniref:centrosomal protein of 97 kDa isoform X2 n=1 Tax=Hyperolius riggenbachi TaxID=752182 RepID=UPI0035A290A6
MAGEEVVSAPVESVAGPDKTVTAVDLSGQGLQKLTTTLPCGADTRTLILDKNQIIKLEHLEKCKNLTQVIDQINSCTSLQHLDLSDNNISQVGDLSKLIYLRTLLLHGNNITSLRTTSACLPQGLTILSLAENEIRDLNEVSFLSGLTDLEQLSIMNNPCVMATPSIPGFDYRPYIVSWCLNLKVLDGYVVSQKESLKAEWLYSQGKGRSYRPGQHVPLVQYLASVCPLTSAHGLQTEEDAKLEKILSKQRLHQRQLMHQVHSESHLSCAPNTRSFSSPQQRSPSHCVLRSAECEPEVKIDTWLGASGCEDYSYASRHIHHSSPAYSSTSNYNNLYLEDIQTDEDKLNCSLLSSESTFVPVALGLSPVSPTVDMRVPGISNEEGANETVLEFNKGTFATASHEKQTDSEAEMNSDSKQPIILNENVNPRSTDNKASLDSVMEYKTSLNDNNSNCNSAGNLKTCLQNKDASSLNGMNKAATKLQSHWRGFYARKYNSKIKEVRYEVRLSRMQEHIVYLTEEVTRLKKEKDRERMERLVQEEALRYLWDQVQCLKECQSNINAQIAGISKSDTCTLGDTNVAACSSSVLEDPMSSAISVPEKVHRKNSPDIPDSGFHSINIEHDSHQEMSSSEKGSTEGSASSEQSLETVRPYHQQAAQYPVDQEKGVGEHSESSKDTSGSEQDSSLLQQYLDKVEQLEQAEDNTSQSDITEESRPETTRSSISSDFLSSSISHVIGEDGKPDILHINNDPFQPSEEVQDLQKPFNTLTHMSQMDLTPL